jgi:hypothetical protein
MLAFFLCIYFIPSAVASGKKHIAGIFILNLFLGWTFLGWVIALVWAVSDEKLPKKK